VGLAVPALRVLYDYSWFVGFVTAFGAYWAMMRGARAEITSGAWAENSAD